MERFRGLLVKTHGFVAARGGVVLDPIFKIKLEFMNKTILFEINVFLQIL
jgi:hypothetical protein